MNKSNTSIIVEQFQGQIQAQAEMQQPQWVSLEKMLRGSLE